MGIPLQLLLAIQHKSVLHFESFEKLAGFPIVPFRENFSDQEGDHPQKLPQNRSEQLKYRVTNYLLKGVGEANHPVFRHRAHLTALYGRYPHDF